MADFVMPTAEEFAEMLHAQRRDMIAHFDKEGWNASSRKLLKRLDRLIAKFEG
jgi:hypothetical protein